MPKLLKTATFPLCGLGLLLSACGPVDDRVEITDQRELPAGHEAPPLGKSLRERMVPEATMKPQLEQPGGPGAPGGADLTDLFRWETPEGWTEAAATPMRLVNLRFGEGEVGECYLTILTGAGGGLQANVGRWYGQMGLVAPGAEAIEELPRARLLNREAVVIDVEGTFSGMGAAPKPDYRMVGRILPEQASGDSMFSMFLKMTGPKEVVAANLEKFEQFCQSLAPKQMADPQPPENAE
ncbi:MAG: hypothetical protein ACR2RV_21370 [Verrucomicrobiales bacterium]